MAEDGICVEILKVGYSSLVLFINCVDGLSVMILVYGTCLPTMLCKAGIVLALSVCLSVHSETAKTSYQRIWNWLTWSEYMLWQTLQVIRFWLVTFWALKLSVILVFNPLRERWTYYAANAVRANAYHSDRGHRVNLRCTQQTHERQNWSHCAVLC